MKTVELTLRNLGFTREATIIEIFDAAQNLGFRLCSLELAPHLRMQYMDQPEGYLDKPIRKHRAPYGSLTVASKLLTNDESFPKGFYLRCIEGQLWLRAYISELNHLWQLDDHFVFIAE